MEEYLYLFYVPLCFTDKVFHYGIIAPNAQVAFSVFVTQKQKKLVMEVTGVDEETFDKELLYKLHRAKSFPLDSPRVIDLPKGPGPA